MAVRADCGMSDDTGDLEEHLNRSLEDVLDLLARDVERLKAELEYWRLSGHPNKDHLIRRYVARIDARQDRMEEVKAMILARGDRLH